MQTEQRLKELFRRDRQHVEMLKKTKIDRLNNMQEARENADKVTELEAEVNRLVELSREKDGISAVIREEMTAQKRHAYLAQSRLKAMEAPFRLL